MSAADGFDERSFRELVILQTVMTEERGGYYRRY